MTDRVPELNFNNKNYYSKYLPSMYIRLLSLGEMNSEGAHAAGAILRPLGPGKLSLSIGRPLPPHPIPRG